MQPYRDYFLPRTVGVFCRWVPALASSNFPWRTGVCRASTGLLPVRRCWAQPELVVEGRWWPWSGHGHGGGRLSGEVGLSPLVPEPWDAPAEMGCELELQN